MTPLPLCCRCEGKRAVQCADEQSSKQHHQVAPLTCSACRPSSLASSAPLLCTSSSIRCRLCCSSCGRGKGTSIKGAACSHKHVQGYALGLPSQPAAVSRLPRLLSAAASRLPRLLPHACAPAPRPLHPPASRTAAGTSPPAPMQTTPSDSRPFQPLELSMSKPQRLIAQAGCK